jgi:hypothetical protein
MHREDSISNGILVSFPLTIKSQYALAGEIRNGFLKSRSILLKMSVKQIDEHVSSSRLTAKVAPAQAPQSIVESVAETADDDNNVEMLDDDEVKDTRSTETDDKMATIEPVTEILGTRGHFRHDG